MKKSKNGFSGEIRLLDRQLDMNDMYLEMQSKIETALNDFGDEAAARDILIEAMKNERHPNYIDYYLLSLKLFNDNVVAIQTIEMGIANAEEIGDLWILCSDFMCDCVDNKTIREEILKQAISLIETDEDLEICYKFVSEGHDWLPKAEWSIEIIESIISKAFEKSVDDVLLYDIIDSTVSIFGNKKAYQNAKKLEIERASKIEFAESLLEDLLKNFEDKNLLEETIKLALNKTNNYKEIIECSEMLLEHPKLHKDILKLAVEKARKEGSQQLKECSYLLSHKYLSLKNE